HPAQVRTRLCRTGEGAVQSWPSCSSVRHNRRTTMRRRDAHGGRRKRADPHRLVRGDERGQHAMREVLGTQSTVVCVHGAGGGGWEWAVWARVLGARGFDVMAPDLQPVADGIAATRLHDYRAQVAGWCEGAGQMPILIGASLGGLLALAVARSVNPAALVLVNPMPPGGVAGSIPSPPVIPWRSRRSLSSTRRAMPDCDDASRLFAYRHWRDESGAVLDEAHAGI